MLTAAQQETLFRGGYATAHDPTVMSFLAGEPIWDDCRLAYFDGKLLTYYDFPLRGALTTTERPVQERLAKLLDAYEPEGVMYISGGHIDLRFLGRWGYSRTVSESRHPRRAELAIATGPCLTRQGIRRSRNAARFDVTVGPANGISARRLALIEQFYRSVGTSPYLSDFAFALQPMLCSPQFRLVEASLDGQLVGFASMNRPFAEIAVATCMFRQPGIAGVSDALYAGLRKAAADQGCEWLNVGASPSVGIFRYKLSWGATELCPPYYLSQWSRGAFGRRVYSGWGSRLMRCKEPVTHGLK